MMHPIRAWVLEEKEGGRKGKWAKATGVPFHYPIKTALFKTHHDALRYMINSGQEDKYLIVCVQISLQRRENTPLDQNDNPDQEKDHNHAR
jgi:hypothetical protein